MTNKIKQKLEIWERKILRRTFGAKLTDLGWKKRLNEELYELLNESLTSNFVKSRRLQWLGHLERMEQEREVKQVAWKTPQGKRKRGRPRKRWRVAVEEDLEEKKIQNWRQPQKIGRNGENSQGFEPERSACSPYPIFKKLNVMTVYAVIIHENLKHIKR
nr:unnamed protein product [Callosobruchus chinensis]